MRLASNELAIMQTLWNAPRPLTRKEILATCGGLKCKKRTIYCLLNSLIEKKAIYIAGYISIGERRARVFAPCLSQAGYVAKVVSELLPQEKYNELIRLLKDSSIT